MTKKVSFIVPCRDKAGFVANTVKSVLAQTYSPMEIVLSDQGSVDGTYDIIKGLADSYTGENTVRVLQCPETDYRGMAGLNKHLNWLHTQIDGDVVIMCSADDLNHEDRAKYTVEAFEQQNPSYVGTCVQYCDGDLQWKGEQTAYTLDGKLVTEDGWVNPAQCVRELIGSSASSAWARDLWDRFAPLRGIESQDMILPIMALMERGLWYVAKPLHCYIRHASLNNTGLEGCLKAAAEMRDNGATDEEKAQGEAECAAYTELVNFHCTSNYFAILRRITEMQMKGKFEVEGDLYHAIQEKAFHSANGWSMARDNVIMARVQPKMMKV